MGFFSYLKSKIESGIRSGYDLEKENSFIKDEKKKTVLDLWDDASKKASLYKQEMKTKSDSELIRIYRQERHRAWGRAMSAMNELKKRNHSPEYLKKLMRE